LSQGSRDPRQICKSSASEICSLLELFRVEHGLHRLGVQAIYYATIAGVVHTENYSRINDPCPDQQESQSLAFTCMQALGESSPTFRTSLRSIDLLNALRRDWNKGNGRAH
jgi:hypothetical protein